MKKLLFFISIGLLFVVVGCSTPKDKAIKLIEATSSDYKEQPIFTFTDKDVEPIVDKDINDIIGYSLKYRMKIGDENFYRKAIFNKDINIITDDKSIQEWTIENIKKMAEDGSTAKDIEDLYFRAKNLYEVELSPDAWKELEKMKEKELFKDTIDSKN